MLDVPLLVCGIPKAAAAAWVNQVDDEKRLEAPIPSQGTIFGRLRAFCTVKNVVHALNNPPAVWVQAMTKAASMH